MSAVYGLLDRDYRCAEEINELKKETRSVVPNFHVLAGKEISKLFASPGSHGTRHKRAIER